MPAELALELYYLAIRHVDSPADLRSLALCCWAFRDEAQRCLFGCVKLNNLCRQRRFLSAINGEPLRLGPLVHSLYIDVKALHHFDHLASLSRALHEMLGLKHLKLSRCQTPSEILRGCTFQLLTFVCDNLLEGTEEFFLLSDFLPMQTGIKHLEIYLLELVDVSKVPIGLCPGLDCIGTNYNHLVSALLPDTQTLSQLQWRDSIKPPPLNVRQLNRLKSLTLSIHAFEANALFTSHLTSLVNLELRVYLSDFAPFVPDLPFLRYIPRLTILRLNFLNLRLDPSDTECRLGRFAPFQKSFVLCPLLEHIHITEPHMDATIITFVRQKTAQQDIFVWTRQSVHSTNIGEWRYLTV